ncbi:hypothetical protein [Serratia sp. CC22-02]|uniref:hypothetical protein n=1 Tax=Serratia sp. CC22-02 TaxID=1378076 RepID=UPI0024B6A16C|nr:hypothetical protein [Serratia sp. CC22-02]
MKTALEQVSFSQIRSLAEWLGMEVTIPAGVDTRKPLSMACGSFTTLLNLTAKAEASGRQQAAEEHRATIDALIDDRRSLMARNCELVRELDSMKSRAIVGDLAPSESVRLQRRLKCLELVDRLMSLVSRKRCVSIKTLRLAVINAGHAAGVDK